MSSVGTKEVARRAGVSVGTVSNVINRPEVVSAKTRERVLEAIREVGYVPNEVARGLRIGRTLTIGLVVLDIGNPFFVDLARGVEELADEHGSTVVLCNSNEDPLRERKHLGQLEARQVRGIIITPVSDEIPHLEDLAAKDIPVILVNRAPGRNHCTVAVDDTLGGWLAGKHLRDLGHRSAAFVGGHDALKPTRDRREGFLDAAGPAEPDGMQVLTIHTDSLSVEDGVAAGRQLASMDPEDRPTGVFCANDMIALGLLQEMTRQRIRVPEDLAIVGYDDIHLAASAAVPLSSIRQPREQLGRAALELLLEEERDGKAHAHRHIVFQPELIVRESSGGPRA